jgi:hypothetical protein
MCAPGQLPSSCYRAPLVGARVLLPLLHFCSAAVMQLYQHDAPDSHLPTSSAPWHCMPRAPPSHPSRHIAAYRAPFGAHAITAWPPWLSITARTSHMRQGCGTACPSRAAGAASRSQLSPTTTLPYCSISCAHDVASCHTCVQLSPSPHLPPKSGL